MNGKSKIVNNLPELTGKALETIKTEEVTFRTTCKGCKFNSRCLLAGNSRMIKKRCYIDTIAEKLKIKSETVVNRSNNFLRKYGVDFSLIATIAEDYWLKMSNKQRITDIKCNLEHFAKRTNVTVTNEDMKLFLAVANCYFSAWRNEEYIPCACCGQIIKNSKQRNRKYCDDCKVNHKPLFGDGIKTCIDCGIKFEAFHNREVRCFDCQIQANKIKAKERARRYRERKRNGLRLKS